MARDSDKDENDDDGRFTFSVPVKRFERWVWVLISMALGGWHGVNYLATRANAQVWPGNLESRIQALEISRAGDEATINAVRGNLQDIKADLNRLEGEVLQALGSASNNGRKPKA